MANDERQSETFIREVDEELRRDQLKSLWKRFAPLIIGVCVLIVAVTAGYRGWMWWEERQAAQAGDRFMAALTEIESGDRAKGEAELAAIAAESGAGYSALARLRLAGEKAGGGRQAGGAHRLRCGRRRQRGAAAAAGSRRGSGRRCWRSTPATSPARRSGPSR